jgi:CxxC motif-containing protein (DUF1111 family)
MRLVKIATIALFFIGMPLTFAGFDHQSTSAQQIKASAVEVNYGDPLPGIDSKELGRFNVGKLQFERPHTVEEGLGPNFNHISCVGCHGLPTTGGSLVDKRDLNVQFARINPITGKYDPLDILAGGGSGTNKPLSRHSFKTFADTHPEIPETKLFPTCDQDGSNIPPEAQFVSFRFAPSVYGMGLIESIDDETILANADPDDRDKDGISGRPNISPAFFIPNRFIGRFGFKGILSELRVFSAGSYLVDIGITNPIFRQDRRPNGKDPKCGNLSFSTEIEDKDGFVIDALFDYLTFLAPPPRRQMDDSAQRGEKLFGQLGCVKCHVPMLKTSTNPLAGRSLANREAWLYSDLLAHNMGDELADGIQSDPITGKEWRTTPLWGLSQKQAYLHDGRTSSLPTAIMLHGGEASRVRDNYLKLNNRDRNDLVSFLKSL